MVFGSIIMENSKAQIKQKITTKELILSGIFTALIIVGAFIKIPVPNVPLTLQVMFTNLAGLILGSKLGAFSVLTYVLLGLAGVPVFTKGGGIGYIFMPTFGYLIGFIVGTFAAGKIVESNDKISFKKYLLASFVNLFIVYVFGAAYLYLMKNFYMGDVMSLKNAIYFGILVPLPGDVITVVLSSLAMTKIMPAIKGSGLW